MKAFTTCDGILRHSEIIEEVKTPIHYFKMKNGDFEYVTTPRNVHTTVLSAIDACFVEQIYWKQQIEKLNEMIEPHE